jgi:hypothetical protein
VHYEPDALALQSPDDTQKKQEGDDSEKVSVSQERNSFIQHGYPFRESGDEERKW